MVLHYSEYDTVARLCVLVGTVVVKTLLLTDACGHTRRARSHFAFFLAYDSTTVQPHDYARRQLHRCGSFSTDVLVLVRAG